MNSQPARSDAVRRFWALRQGKSPPLRNALRRHYEQFIAIEFSKIEFLEEALSMKLALPLPPATMGLAAIDVALPYLQYTKVY